MSVAYSSAPMSRRRPLRVFALLLVVVRALSLVLAFEVSGTLHAVVDLLLTVSGEHVAHDDDCASESPGDECPAGCPTCHCGHGPIGSGDVAPAVAAIGSPPTSFAFAMRRDHAPPDSDPGSLYRPPRARVIGG